MSQRYEINTIISNYYRNNYLSKINQVSFIATGNQFNINVLEKDLTKFSQGRFKALKRLFSSEFALFSLNSFILALDLAFETVCGDEFTILIIL